VTPSMRPRVRRSPSFWLAVLTIASLSTVLWSAAAQPLVLRPHNPTGIYEPGATVGWTVYAEGAGASAGGTYTYRITKDWLVVLESGAFDPARGAVTLEARLSEPAMVHLDITAPDGKTRQRAAAAMAPRELRPTVPRPADFDAFWAGKIAMLRDIPAAPELTPAPSGRDGVEYATVRMRHINGAHVHGQLATPAGEGPFPAVLILQWAGGPYPLQKEWVTDRAAEGWLALNVMPHDVPGNMPAPFYAALPQLLKGYNTIYDEDRDRNYFLQMYLGAYRALDFLAEHPNWNGKVLLATGTSMGGQQSLAVAGLHPRVTHVIVHVPAGADANGPTRGRAAGYPFWDATRPRVLETAQYFDTVNFASGIRAKSLLSLGFIDDVCPPVGIWIVYNQIRGPKELVPLVDAPHNHQATQGQQQPYLDRQRAWMEALVRGTEPEVR
jgi:cephalosporin-C deacetylase